MEITQLPFNAFLGLEESEDEDGLLRLPARSDYANHLGTVHASALFALAEASSGALLQTDFAGEGEDVVAVLRGAEIRYRSAAEGAIEASGRIEPDDHAVCLAALEEKGRARLTIEIALRNGAGEAVAEATFDWLLTKQQD